MMASVTKIHVQHLINEGLLQGDVDIDSGENYYKLTDKGKSVATNI
jgi:predicted transcriptional regulator